MVSGHLAVKKNRWYAILCLRHPDGRRYDKWITTGLSYSTMWDPQLLGVLRSLSPSSRSVFAVESLKSATRNFEKLLDILEFLLTHDLKFASTNFYIENGHVERRIKPLRAGHTSKEIQKNLSQTAGLGYRHAAALNQL